MTDRLTDSTVNGTAGNNDYDIEGQKKQVWKPAKFQSYETMGLTKTAQNETIRPCGFRKDGKLRKIKDTCLIARMKNLCVLKETQPKIAACITMYNENESEFKITL